VYGVEVSHETVAKVTHVLIDEVRAWQARPVCYPSNEPTATRIQKP
jgi:transposase-like protein